MFFILFAFFNKPISLAPESHLFEGIYDTIQKNKSDSTTESLSTQTMPLDVTLLDEGQITPYPINFLILNDYGQNRFEQQTLLSKSTRLPPSFHPLRQFENSILYNADRLTDSQIDLIQTSLRQDPAQLPLHQLKVTQLQLARLQQELSETLQPTENSSNQPGKLYTNLTQNIDDTKQQIDTYYQEITELNNLVQTIKIQINNLPKVNLRRTSSLSPKKTTLKQNKSHLKQQIKDIRDNKLPLLEQKLQQLELFKQQHLQENQDITQQTDTSFTKASLLRKHQINADLIMSYLHQAQFTQYPQEFQSLLPQ